MIPHQSDRAFGLTFSVIFSVISAIGWWAYEIPLYWAMVVAALFLIAALLAPWILMPFNRIWFVFSQQLGIVVNYLISVTFFFRFASSLQLPVSVDRSRSHEEVL